jgi:hypothetical protein
MGVPKFIYVYSVQARDDLESMGYQLLTGNDRDGTYVFVYDGRIDFEKTDLNYTLSDTLVL